MRIFWSVMLAGGLLLVGFDVYEARLADRQAERQAARVQGAATAEDGTGFPSPTKPK